MKPAERDKFVSATLQTYIERAVSGDGPAGDRYKHERKVLEQMIPIATDGFRGVTLTAIMGKLVREDINTGTEFSSINPRGVYERGIRPVLRHFRIPSSGSAPLNVAKNVQVLDEKWAEGRKPESAARAAVEYIRMINRHWADPSHRDDLIMIFIQRLVRYADEVAAHDVELAPIDEIPPITLGKRLAKFALAYPEGGSMPQFVVGTIIAAARSSDADFSPLQGVDASVFGTNTTSNKPADLWETLATGNFGNLYEVTCKKVDENRLDAAVDAFSKLGVPTTPITFICRIPADCASLPVDDGVVTHRGMPFQFIDLASFIEINFTLLTADKRLLVLQQISSFVTDPARAVKTKQGWAASFG